MVRFRGVGLLLAGGVALSGCALFGTGGLGDRWSDERNALMRKELAWTVRPPGTVGGELRSADAMTGDGPLAASRSVGAEASFFVPKGLTALDLTDFYVDLFAKQGHRNIYVRCAATQPDNIGIEAAAWTGRYGYVVGANLGRKNPEGGLFETGREPNSTDPLHVQLQMAGNRKMYEGNDEDPANLCPVYPIERMAKVLYPYGLTPFVPGSKWLPFHLPLGERDKYRKEPPRITPRFSPTATKVQAKSG